VADLDFEQLVEVFYMPLYRFALSLSREPFEAADLTQQTFLLWASKGHQLREESKVKAWLFTSLYREFLRGERKRVRESGSEVPEFFQRPSGSGVRVP
jgi:RNA polymerase sigma-70 factor (ECF subfamily)